MAAGWNTIKEFMKSYFYTDGTEVFLNDIVLVNPNRTAHVQLVLEPGSSLANAYSAPNGGIVIEFDDGDYQMWPSTNEDIRLVRRHS